MRGKSSISEEAFLLLCIKNVENVKIDFKAVGEECGITAHSAYCRFDKLKKKIGGQDGGESKKQKINGQNGGENKKQQVGGEDGGRSKKRKIKDMGDEDKIAEDLEKDVEAKSED